MNSFLRKYSKISGIKQKLLKKMFLFKKIIIGVPLNILGASFKFSYAFSSVPSL